MDKTYTSSVTMRPASPRSRYRSTVASSGNAAASGESSGSAGRDGVGISSVKTAESAASGGVNVVTVRLTDGTENKFKVRNGVAGADGKSAYDLAVEAGFDGDETAWLGSLKGERGARGAAGAPGQSAYEMAVAAGFDGDEVEWLDSLKGDKGLPGETGAAAGFGTPTAEAAYIPAGSQPTASVKADGPDSAKVFKFKFGIPASSEDIFARLKARPVLTMMIGTTKDMIGVAEIGVSHPLLQTGSNQYEAVLMAYRGRNGRVTGSAQYIEKLRMYKKGWAVALGDYKLTGHEALTASPGVKFGAAFSVTALRDFIVQRFMTDSGHTQSELMTRTYQQWKSESNKDRGFGFQRRARHRFGVAVRCVNPAFLAAVDPSRTLAPTTQTIYDDNGTRYDRYLYSDVAPLDVMLSTPANGGFRSEMWFGLVER